MIQTFQPHSNILKILRPWDNDLPLHLSLVIDNHASVILEIDELTIFSSEGFPLTDHHSGHDFFPELWFTLNYNG